MQGTLKQGSRALVLGLMMSGQALFAIDAPKAIAFEEGAHIEMSISSINYNRIFVDGETITDLHYNEGTFVVEKGDPNNPYIVLDSVYLKPVFDAPMTIFLTTDKKHHVSLTLRPDDSAGKTIRLVLKQQSTLRYVKRDSDESQIDNAMAAMKAGESPKDYKEERVIPRPFYVKKDIKVSLEKHYQGSELSGYVYRIENKSNHEIALSTALFSHQKAESLSLSAEVLLPKKSAYLYGLYRHDV